MQDIVVTVPANFRHPDIPGKKGLACWLAEGDHPGTEWSGQEWWFTTYGLIPDFTPERCYIVCEGRLIGYAPMLRVLYKPVVSKNRQTHLAFIRGGGAVACTIDEPIKGFRGWRKRWWDRAEERPLDLSAFVPEKIFSCAGKES